MDIELHNRQFVKANNVREIFRGKKLISNTSLFRHNPLCALGWTQRRQDWPSSIIPMWKFARLSKNLKLLARNSFHLCRCLKSGDHQGAASAECEADQDKPRGLSKNTTPKMDLRHRPDGFDLLLPWLCGEPVWYFLWEPPVVVLGFKNNHDPLGSVFYDCFLNPILRSYSCRDWWNFIVLVSVLLTNKLENGRMIFHLYFHILWIQSERDPLGVC